MRVGLYQKFFTWAMLNLVLLGVITALFIGGVLLFNNNLYSPMLFNGSIASTFRMTYQWSCNTNPKANGLRSLRNAAGSAASISAS